MIGCVARIQVLNPGRFTSPTRMFGVALLAWFSKDSNERVKPTAFCVFSQKRPQLLKRWHRTKLIRSQS
jgi:hypothetical protein